MSYQISFDTTSYASSQKRAFSDTLNTSTVSAILQLMVSPRMFYIVFSVRWDADEYKHVTCLQLVQVNAINKYFLCQFQAVCANI